MKKIMLALCVGLLLGGCDATTTEVHGFILPEGLKDCKIYRLRDGISHITVTRCPNSSTSTQYQTGKTTSSSTLVEDSP
jgi:hypothetical protein